MKNNNNINDLIWYLPDGSYYEGKQALDYINESQKELNILMKQIDETIKQINSFNTDKQVIGDDIDIDSPYNRLMNSLENIGFIEILLTSLLDKIRKTQQY